MRPLALPLFLALGAPAQVRLVADLNPGRYGPGFSVMTRATGPGFTWFFTRDGNPDTALWRTDSSVAGTRLLQRFFPGAGTNRTPEPLAVLDGVLMFTAADAAHGNELWRSDGTPQGTWMVADLLPGSQSSFSEQAVQAVLWRGAVWFYAWRSLFQFSLWRTDGTQAGTTRFLDFDDNGVLLDLATTESRLFLARSPRLIATDGTAAGTVTLGVGASRLVSDQERVWFAGPGNATVAGQLWRSDGTVAGTRPVTIPEGFRLERPAFWRGFTWFTSIALGLWRVDTAGTAPERVVAGILASLLTPLRDRLVFVGQGSQSTDVWSTDGTSAGTAPLAATDRSLVAFGERALFTNTTALRVTDGTPPGTRTLRDFGPGGAADLSTCITIGGRAFFVAERSGEGRELWVTDGAPSGTRLVRDIRPGPLSSDPGSLSVENGLLLFVADDGVSGPALWRSDGTEVGTFPLWTSMAVLPRGSWPMQLVPSGPQGGVFLRPRASQANANQLWFSDGTAAGTRSLGVYLANIIERTPLAARDGVVCFSATAPFVGTTLWRSDGTVAGTTPLRTLGTSGQVVDVQAGEHGFHVLQQDYGHRPPAGMQLWRTDGTPTGTATVWSWTQSATQTVPRLWPQPAAATGDRVWILGAAEPATGAEPWISDGTTTGTRLLLDIAPGPDSSHPAEPALLGDTVFFVADDHVRGRELWRSDGTATGTRIAADVWPGASGSAPRLLTPVGDRLYFLADDGVHGEELWCTDTTPAGAHLVRDVRQGPIGCSANLLTALGDRLLFAATDEIHGYELWVSDDATAAGTRLLVDLAPQGASGVPAADSFVVPVPGSRFVLFGATNGVRPMMLWRTDGTPGGTLLWDDVALGSRAYSQQPVVSGNQIFLIADDGTTGLELFVAPSPAAATSVGRGCALNGPPPVLRAAGLPTLGNPGFALELVGMAPNTDAVLALSAWPADLALSPECVVRVAPPLLASLVARTSASGAARLVLPVPSEPSLHGQQLFAQGAAASPTLAMSPGLRLVLARE